MNYIAEIKAFYDLVQVKQLSQGQIALWHALMYINNKCAWIEWFSVPNIMLELNTGLSRSGIAKARNVLKQYGLIDFKPNGTKATSYKLITMLKSEQVGNQDSKQDGKQVGNQSGTQNSGTLNKRNEVIYLNLIKNAREQFRDGSFSGTVKAQAWAKEQPEWNELTEEERMRFLSEV